MVIKRALDDVTEAQRPDKAHVVENVSSQFSNVNNDRVEFDDLLSSAGKLGRYQIILFLSTAPFYLYGVFGYITQLFLTEVSPNHWCWIPELENLTAIERRNLAIPVDNDSRFGYSQCKAYDANWTEVLSTHDKPDTSWSTVPCRNGWEFNKTEIPYPTISSEMGWVCDKDSYQATAQCIFVFGCIVGGFIIGWVADRFGRLPATAVSNIIICTGGIASIYARNFVEFATCRFFMGLGYDNCFMMVYLLLLEYTAPQYRTLMANLSFAMFYSAPLVAVPWIALAAGHWKTISLVTSIPMVFAVFTPFVLPESPRWMLSKGRVDDTIKKILTVSKINKIGIPPQLIERFKASETNAKQEDNKNILEVLKRPLLRKIFIIICLEYICCELVYDALVRSIGTLDFDFFISFSAISATDFPSLLIIAFIMDWTGRRWLATITFMIGAVFCFLTVFIGGGLAAVLCAVVARFTVSTAYGVATQWIAELLPTPVRGTGSSIVHICGFIGTMISPLIVYLENVVYWLPLVVTGCIAVLGTIFAFLLPETANMEMPQTFDDAEEKFRHQSYWYFPCHSKKSSKVNKLAK